MALSVRTADESTIRLLDGAVVAWMILWLAVGGWSAYTVWELSDVGDTVTTSGTAISSAGEALESLREVPVVGERPAELGEEAALAGAEIQTRGQQVKSQLRQLSVLLGLAVTLIPTTPVLGLYVPLRRARQRERREISRVLQGPGPDAGFERYLAERAVRHLSWSDVRRLVDDPWQAMLDGRHLELANAELARLGLSRSSGRSSARA